MSTTSRLLSRGSGTLGIVSRRDPVTDPLWPLVRVLAEIAERVEREDARRPPPAPPDAAPSEADPDADEAA